MAALNFGAGAISTLKVGNSQVDRVYLGADLVWQNASISASPNPVLGDLSMTEPAPSSRTVSAGTTLGGAGLTSATWVKISGGDIGITPDTNGLTPTFSALVSKNDIVSAVFRATGNHGLTVDVPVDLSYSTDL